MRFSQKELPLLIFFIVFSILLISPFTFISISTSLGLLCCSVSVSFSLQHFIIKIFRQNKQNNYSLNIHVIPFRFYNECFAVFALLPICVLIPLFFHQSPFFCVCGMHFKVSCGYQYTSHLNTPTGMSLTRIKYFLVFFLSLMLNRYFHKRKCKTSTI